MTRCTSGKNIKEIAKDENALPTSPQRVGFMSTLSSQPAYKVPGYAGFVSGKRSQHSKTFGETTRTLALAQQRKKEQSVPKMPKTRKLKKHSFTKGTEQPVPNELKRGRIPGYCGFIPNGQHVAGSTYGCLTRAVSHPEFTPDSQNALPQEPQHSAPRDNQERPKHRLPGYTGFVPGMREKFSDTFGTTTRELQIANDTPSSTKTRPKSAGAVRSKAQTNEPSFVRANADRVRLANSKSTATGAWVAPPPVMPPQELKDGHIPGYSGFVRGSQIIPGTTFGSMTRRAKKLDMRNPDEASALPVAPNHVKFPPKGDEKAAVHPHYKVPGYTGHVSGNRDVIAQTFGTSTDKMVEQALLQRLAWKKAQQVQRKMKEQQKQNKQQQKGDKRSRYFQKQTQPWAASSSKTDKDNRFSIRAGRNSTGRVPGYCGFVPKAQHIAGATYGNMTRFAQTQDFSTIDAPGALPVSPTRHLPYHSRNV